MKTSNPDNYVITYVDAYMELGGVWLDIKATHETIDAVYEIHIPKVRLMDDNKLRIDNRLDICAPSELVIPSNRLNVCGKYKITKIKDKTVKMTVEEIEKKLGHKIEIISK